MRGKTAKGDAHGRRPASYLRRGGVCLILGAIPAAYAQQAASDAPADPAAGSAKPAAPKITNLADVHVQGHTGGYVATHASTGSKTDAPIIDNPQSISIVTRQQIEDQGAQTIDQALRYTTGVYSQDGTDLRFDQLNARGFAMDSYLDGLHLYPSPRFAVPRVDPYLLEQIDVLRGPSSVLYGQGNPGGLVNFVSKLPTDTPHNEVALQIGNRAYHQLGFDLGGAANQDGSVLYRVVGLGRVANTQAGAIEDHRFAIAPSVSFRPDADTSFTLLGGFQRDPEGGLFNPVPSGGTVFGNPNGKLGPNRYFGDPDTDRMNRTQYWIGDQFEHRFNDVWSVSQSLRYLHMDQHYYQTSVTSNYLTGPAYPPASTVMMWANLDNERYGQLAGDVHAQARFATGPVEHTVVMGFDYANAKLDDRVGNAASYTGGLVGTVNLYDPDFSGFPKLRPGPLLKYSLWQVGTYAEDMLRYRHWVLTVGARQDWTNTTVHAPVGKTTVTQGGDADQFTWRAGLAYEFANGIVPYASYTTSFEPALGVNAQGNPFKPTQGKQAEAGIRYQPAGYQAYFTLAVYNLRETNVATTDPANPVLSVQTGEIRSRGIEAEAHANLSDNLRLIASYNHINQRITADTRFRGKRPTITPRDTASVWLDYTLSSGLLRDLGFGAGVRYVGTSEGDQANSFEVPARTLMDVSAHYDWQRWRLALNVSNLFDREYVSYCSTATVCYWGATRSVLATARYQW